MGDDSSVLHETLSTSLPTNPDIMCGLLCDKARRVRLTEFDNAWEAELVLEHRRLDDQVRERDGACD